MPHEIAAMWSRKASPLIILRVFIHWMQSCSATHPPVIAAVRVPPSAWITSQSMVIWRSPSATRSTTARRLRPISRWISMVRPPCLPAEASRRVRSSVARGSIPYSAVIQPRAWPLSQGGSRSSRVAVTSTWVSPNFTKQEPSAYLTTPRSSVTARSSSGCRRLGRMMSPVRHERRRCEHGRFLEHDPEKWKPVFATTSARLGPGGEAQSGTGAGRRAIARDILEPVEVEMFHGAGKRHPVEDFRAAGMELVARQVLQKGRILVGARLEDGVIEVFVHQEVAQASRCRHADAGIARKALHRGAQRLPERVAPARPRLVGRIVGVEEDRHDRDRIGGVHDAAVDVRDGVSF